MTIQSSEPHIDKQDQEALPSKSLFGRICTKVWQYFKRLTKVLLLLIALIYGLLWLPPVQTKLGHLVADVLSNLWETEVRIDRLEIWPLTDFVFHDVFIRDHDQDTLIYAGEVEAQNYNIFALFQKEISIGHMTIKDAVFKVQRRPHAEFFNIHFIIAFFEGGARTGPPPPKFKFSLGGAELRNARVHLADTAIGTAALITCDTGYITSHPTQGVDMIGKYAWGNIAHLSNANITVRLFDMVPIPNEDSLLLLEAIDTTIPDWNVGCERLKLDNVNFRLINKREGFVSNPNLPLDFTDLHFNNINLDVDTFRLQHEVFTGHIRKLHGLNHGGFELKHLSGDALISPNQVAVTNFNLKTNNSSIGHHLILSYNGYRSFYDYPNKVHMKGVFDNKSVVTFRDIAAFAPPMVKNVFIGSNLDHPIQIKGRFDGTVNNLHAYNVVLKVLGSTIKGDISLNDITNPNAAFMDLNLKEVNSSYRDLTTILPFVDLPPNLSSLGQMTFKGTYIGYFDNFVADGYLKTGIGDLKSDLKLNLQKGKQGAAYDGGLLLDNFDIGAFVDNEDLGRLSVKADINGTGLTLETLNATLQNTKIDSLFFKGYKYEDILINGDFKQKRFDGDILSKDSNMDLFVRGIMDLNGELPNVDILGNVKNLDLYALNITQERAGLQLDTFDINAMGSNIDNFVGVASIRGIKAHRGQINSELSSIYLNAQNYPGDSTLAIVGKDSVWTNHQTRKIALKSDVLDVQVWGEYDVLNLVRSINKFIKDYHPNLYQEIYKIPKESLDSIKFGIPQFASFLVDSSLLDSIPHQDFYFQIRVPDNTRNLTQLIDTNFKYLEYIDLTGEYDGSGGYLDISGQVGAVHIGNVAIQDIDLKKGQADGPTFNLNSTIKNLLLNGKEFVPDIDLTLDAIRDSVHFNLSAEAVGEFAKTLSINGQLSIQENKIILELDTSSLFILDQKWTINDNNHIKIGQEALDIENVVLFNQDKRVALSSVNNNKGAKIEVENLSLKWLYGFMEPLPMIKIDGVFSGNATMSNVFTQEEITANVLLDTLLINGDYWGSNSRLTASADNLKSNFRGLFTHNSSFVEDLKVTATFTPKAATPNPALQNFLDINIKGKRAKAKILEYFIGEQISNTEGDAFVDMRIFTNIKGKNTVLNAEGEGLMTGVKTTINFLQTRYVIDDGKIRIDNEGFHIDPELELDIYDQYESGGVGVTILGGTGKKAYLGGSLTHNHLKNFGLDAKAVFKNNLMMNTTLADNDLFYGKVYASGTASFTGPFERLKLKVDARTEENTTFNLPFGGPLTVTETDYIKFIDVKANADSAIQNSTQRVNTGGLDIEIIADIQPSAVARLIIDEQAGDVIEGRGSSDNMRITYDRSGDLKIFGTYVIEEGNYLFTYRNLINKPFDVKKGGTITWGDNDGDPTQARLDIQAAYVKNLGVSNLVTSYTANDPELAKLANTPCRVNLLMDIKGALFTPQIDFKINVSDVIQRLQNPVALALREIHADKNELNRQVFGLIVLQQFLPLENANNVNVVSSGINTGISTLTELVSQQFSRYINDLLVGVVKDVDFISSLEFDFNFNIRDSESQNIRSRTSNVRLGSDVKFLDDRLRVYAGANLDIASDDDLGIQDNGNYIGGDFIIEYFITEDGRLRIKAYNRTENTILGRSMRTGAGLSYRKEFNSLQELVEEAQKNREQFTKKRLEKKQKKVTELNQLLAITQDETIREQLLKKKERLERKVQRLQKRQEKLSQKK